ncbi:uncharacterized protein LOC144434235 [Glandiceps talaboti]
MQNGNRKSDKKKELWESLFKVLGKNGFVESNGWTAVHVCAVLGYTKVIQLLLDNGSAVDKLSGCQQTPLLFAALFGREKAVNLLIERGADIHALGKFKATALHAAATNGHHRIVKLLLDRGANIEQKTISQQTPLMYAALSGCEKSVNLLIERGADIHAVDEVNATALHAAANFGHHRIVKLLLDRGANIEQKTINGYTVLHCGVLGRRISVIEVLLQAGAIDNRQNKYGNTALDLAVKLGYHDIVNLLSHANSNQSRKYSDIGHNETTLWDKLQQIELQVTSPSVDVAVFDDVDTLEERNETIQDVGQMAGRISCIKTPKPNKDKPLCSTQIKRIIPVAGRNSKRMLKCSKCPKTFYSLKQKNEHEQTHVKDNGSVCTLCHLTFESKLKLNKHKKTKHGVHQQKAARGLLKRAKRKKIFSVSQRKKQPKRIHKCKYCDKKFGTRSAVAAHEKIHERMHSLKQDVPNKLPKCELKENADMQIRTEGNRQLKEGGESPKGSRDGNESSKTFIEELTTADNRNMSAINLPGNIKTIGRGKPCQPVMVKWMAGVTSPIAKTENLSKQQQLKNIAAVIHDPKTSDETPQNESTVMSKEGTEEPCQSNCKRKKGNPEEGKPKRTKENTNRQTERSSTPNEISQDTEKASEHETDNDTLERIPLADDQGNGKPEKKNETDLHKSEGDICKERMDTKQVVPSKLPKCELKENADMQREVRTDGNRQLKDGGESPKGSRDGNESSKTFIEELTTADSRSMPATTLPGNIKTIGGGKPRRSMMVELMGGVKAPIAKTENPSKRRQLKNIAADPKTTDETSQNESKVMGKRGAEEPCQSNCKRKKVNRESDNAKRSKENTRRQTERSPTPNGTSQDTEKASEHETENDTLERRPSNDDQGNGKPEKKNESDLHKSEGESYSCDICSKKYKYKRNMLKHRREHFQKANSYECGICDRTFATNQNLKEHMIVYSTEKPFKCEECGRGYKRKKDLNVHQRKKHSA